MLKLVRDEWMKLSDICYVYSGYALKSFNDSEEGLPVVKIGNILTDGTLDLDSCQYTTDNVNDKYYSNKGDIYIALSGATTGKIGMMYNDEKYIINQRVGIVRKKNENIPQNYIKYFLLRQTDRILQEAAGCAQPNISPRQIAEYLVPNISEDKMINICLVLDKVKSVIDFRKQELQKLDELVKARFVEMFGDPELNEKKWNIEKLEKLCLVGSSKRIYQNEQSTKGVPFLRISDLINRMDTGKNACDLCIPEERFLELKEQGLVPQTGDILLTARGTLGRCYIIKSDDKFYFQDGMITWLSNFDDRVTSLYISFLFSITGFRKQIDALQAGSTVAYLSIAMTKKLDVMIPPIELQNQFAAFVVQIDKSKAVVQRALDETQLLFDSLMQEYFG
jgi:type I restriction enzyme S subunit